MKKIKVGAITAYDENGKPVNLDAFALTPESNAVEFVPEHRVLLSGNILTANATLTAGWTGDNASGYTHTAGTAPLTFPAPTEAGAIYICRLTTSYTAGEFARIAIGSAYPMLMYKEKADLVIPLIADGGKLTITPFASFSGTISNITLRKVQETGQPLDIGADSILAPAIDNSYGFWNVLLTDIFSSPGTTRTIAIGHAALSDLTGGHRMIAIGTFAGSHMTGGERVIAIGADNMLNAGTAQSVVSIGDGALYKSPSTKQSVIIGSNAVSSTAGAIEGDVAIGPSAGYYMQFGDYNVLIGANAGYKLKVGSRNTIIGGDAQGANGRDLTLIGASIKSDTDAALQNVVAIGSRAKPTKSNQIIIGTSSAEEVLIAGKKISFNPDGTVTWTEA